MHQLLFRIGAFSARRRLTVVAAWLALAVAVTASAGLAGSAASDDATISGSDSAAATALLERGLPQQATSTSPFLVEATSGRLTDDRQRDAVARMIAALERAPHVESVSDPLAAANARDLGDDGRVGVLRVTTDLPQGEVSPEIAEEIYTHGAEAESDDVRIEAGGDIGQRLSRERPRISEIVGLSTAVLVLLAVLGGAVAMAVPLLTALVGLVVGLGLITLLTHVGTVPDVAHTLGTMIGLGVGIDYALFLISRYREARAAGMDVPDAAGTAQATAGTAVGFAAATVVVALLSLAVAGIAPVTGLGYTAAAVVAVAMLAATTLLPALLGLAGSRIDALAVRRDTAGAQARSAHRWRRWARAVVRRRWAATALSVVLLGTLAIPTLSLRLGQEDVGAQSTSTTGRQAHVLNERAFGAGANGPLAIAVELDRAASEEDPRLEALRDDIEATAGVAQVSPARLGSDGTVAVLDVEPDSAPADVATEDLVDRLREEVLPEATRGQGMTAHVGGRTAAQIDMAGQIAGKLPLIIGVVVGLSFVLLLVAFRSVALPLKAAAMNLLSVGAAYGVLVAVFQWGWGASLIGLDGPVPIVSFVPMLMFAILFGLSMDYEVFLLSRVQEHHELGEADDDSIVRGLAATGRIITAAALIMVAVFGSFLLTGDPLVKMFGVGLAAAIAIDATVVRCLLVPAVMGLLGRASWWCPRWLARLLPRIDLEGASWSAGRTAEDPA
jgi:RND superfamily putative drug exporter